MFDVVYLGLGSNIGDRESYLNRAIDALDAHEQIEVMEVSSFIETQAIGKMPQPLFLNGVVSVSTFLAPIELLDVTESIEKQLGRESKGTYDPRTIDIDLLFYGQQLICEERLIVPHPMLHEREFVLTPLNEIAPDFVHPILGETVSNLGAYL